MDRPELPEITEGMDAAAIRAVFEPLRAFADETLASDAPDMEFLGLFADLGDILIAKEAAEALAARAAATLSATAVAEPEVEEVVEETVEEAPVVEDTTVVEEAADATDAEDSAVEEVTEEVDASADASEDDSATDSGGDETEESEVDRPNADDLAGDTDVVEGDLAGNVTTTARVLPGVPGFTPDAPINSRLEVAKALGSKWQTVADSGSGERFSVVQLKATYPDFADFTDGNFDGLYDDSIVAACAPLQPYYGVGFYSSEARPVFGSLPKFNAPRGGVTIYQSPLFSDTGLIASNVGKGQWTYTDDNNVNATKNVPYDFVCGTTEDFKVYGVYKSMTIRNLDAITFPELVAAHQNQLGARFARYAETLILDAMVAQADQNVNASATYGASRTVLSRLSQITGQFREKERLDDSGLLDIWLPRWIRDGLREDVIRAANDSGVPEVVADATIASWFADFGAVPHFTYDAPTAYGNITPQTGGVVNGWPDTFWYILSPKGNLGMLDLGTIDIGVNPTGTYRDTTLVSRNRFQLFMESFEGLVNRGAPVWRGSIEFLPNGAQPAGVTAISSNTGI